MGAECTIGLINLISLPYPPASPLSGKNLPAATSATRPSTLPIGHRLCTTLPWSRPYRTVPHPARRRVPATARLHLALGPLESSPLQALPRCSAAHDPATTTTTRRQYDDSTTTAQGTGHDDAVASDEARHCPLVPTVPTCTHCGRRCPNSSKHSFLARHMAMACLPQTSASALALPQV